MTLGTLFLFSFYLFQGLEKARTVAFVAMAFFQIFNAFNMRSLKRSLFEIGLGSNKFIVFAFFASIVLQAAVIHIPLLKDVFRFASLTFFDWLGVVLVASSVLWLGEFYKFLRKKYKKAKDLYLKRI
jgi:Ca2+-transporting ATPase